MDLSRVLSAVKRKARSSSLRVKNRLARVTSSSQDDESRTSLLRSLRSKPTDAGLHLQLAAYYLERGEAIRAVAACRTCLTLGGDLLDVQDLLRQAYKAAGCNRLAIRLPEQLPDGACENLLELSPLIYQRNQMLASRIKELDARASVLDVGGGDGYLSLFLPGAQYALIDPRTNGLEVCRGLFADDSFDLVVACHVFEHIVDAEKEQFLDTLCGFARNSVLLLGPFAETDYDAAMPAFIYEQTGLSWAREHIDCGLPTLDDIGAYARRHGLRLSVSPNGNRAAAFWMVFARHFARRAGDPRTLKEVERFSNRHLNGTISNPNQPNDYLIELRFGEQS